MKIDLREKRHNLGMSLDAMSEATGIPKSTLDRIERGVSEPVPGTKLKLAQFHELEVTEIWPVDEKAGV